MLNRSRNISLAQDVANPVDETGISSSVSYVDIVHELSADFTSDTIERLCRVSPSPRAQFFKVRSRVAPSAAQKLKSPQYLASIRRKRAKSIAELVTDMSRHASRDDFVMVVHPVLEKIRAAITFLQDADEEGNSREILRQLRDSMMDGQWEQYKTTEVRQAALNALKILAGHEEVTAESAFATANAFEDAGFGVSGPNLIDVQ